MKDHATFIEKLRTLYVQQLSQADQANSEVAEYLTAHSGMASALARQVETVEQYLPHVRGRVLDWGCMHAPDSCLLKMMGSESLELHGCDFFPPGLFPIFHDFAGLQYRKLHHASRLPYPRDHFDTVIADGVLEHAAHDYDSLGELYRVLREGGRLIICCLPNRFSWTEWLARRLNRPHHLRTYSRRETRSMLLHRGFRPLVCRYQQMVPTFSGRQSQRGFAWLASPLQKLWKLNPVLEGLWPINCISSNLFAVAEKCHGISWTKEAA